MALGRAHAEGVPRLHDGDAGAGALDEGVHDLRAAGSVGVHGMGSEPGPRRAVGAELLAAGQAVAALDPFRPARRQQDRDVVAGLGVSGGEHLAVEGGVEHPAQRAVAGPVELGGDADPVRVHAHRQCRRRRVASEAALAGGHLGEVEAPSAEVCRHGGGQVADLAELGQVVVEVGVGAVELAGAGAEAVQQFDRQLGQLPGLGGGECAHGGDDPRWR